MPVREGNEKGNPLHVFQDCWCADGWDFPSMMHYFTNAYEERTSALETWPPTETRQGQGPEINTQGKYGRDHDRCTTHYGPIIQRAPSS